MHAPYGSRIDVGAFSFYTVKGADFNLPAQTLADDVKLDWHDLCNDPADPGNSNCNPDPPVNRASSQSLITQLASTTATTIHNAAHAAVTAVPEGSTVHDFVTVTGVAGIPSPPATSARLVHEQHVHRQPAHLGAPRAGPLGNGTVDATSFPQGPLAPGLRLQGALPRRPGEPGLHDVRRAL